MGGDDAPAVVLEGSIQAAQKAGDRIELLLFGPEDVLREGLAKHDTDGLPIRIVDAPEVIGMAESPVSAVKSKQRSSIHLGLGAHKQGHADAFVSAGNTGAVMAAALFILGRLPGVSRPTLMGYFPTTKGMCYLVDVGSNVDCKPEHLVQFAHMGSIYAQRVMKVDRPVIGLLNVGEEPGKGNEQVKETFDLLQQEGGLNFRGNIEGRDVLHHAADVVVCDGFVGNALLKFGESVPTAFTQMLRDEMQAQQLGPEQQQTIARVLGGVRERFNPDGYGGAPLLGIDGNVRIGHGSATPRAIEQMILAAADSVEHELRRHLAEAFST
jgi:glycerol-3-phosphate acyltransferase PlsX